VENGIKCYAATKYSRRFLRFGMETGNSFIMHFLPGRRAWALGAIFLSLWDLTIQFIYRTVRREDHESGKDGGCWDWRVTPKATDRNAENADRRIRVQDEVLRSATGRDYHRVST
jgi:hypothetical protein